MAYAGFANEFIDPDAIEAEKTASRNRRSFRAAKKEIPAKIKVHRRRVETNLEPVVSAVAFEPADQAGFDQEDLLLWQKGFDPVSPDRQGTTLTSGSGNYEYISNKNDVVYGAKFVKTGTGTNTAVYAARDFLEDTNADDAIDFWVSAEGRHLRLFLTNNNDYKLTDAEVDKLDYETIMVF